MSAATGSGSLPHHLYVWADRGFTRRQGQGFEPAVWFGLRSFPGRAWGCHVMLECGAVVRDLPLNALATQPLPEPWSLRQAQHWDCYGEDFALTRYTYLQGLEARVRVDLGEVRGDYLFTACPLRDGFSAAPEQAKEFMFLATHGGRITAQPTNRVLFEERSFTLKGADWPTDIKRQVEVWASEAS
jgi:hypothetical protein